MRLREKTVVFLAAVLIIGAMPPGARAEQIRTSFLYDETTDRLTVRLWLERSGVAIRNTSSDKFGEATLEIYDETSDDWFPEQTLTPPDAGDLETYIFTWTLNDATTKATPIRLAKGRMYFARCTMRYGGPSGTGFTYQTGATLTVAVTSALRDVSASAASLRSKIAGIKEAVTDENVLTREVVESKTGGVLVASEVLRPTQEATSAGEEAGKPVSIDKARILVSETVAWLGSLVTIRFRTHPDVSPSVTVYDPDRVVRVATARMIEEKEGVYKYFLHLERSWPEGNYTVICSEGRYGTMDTLVLTVKRPDLTTLAGAAGFLPGRGAAPPTGDATSKVRALSAIMEVVEARLSQAAGAMIRMQEGTAGTTEVAEFMASLYNDLKELSKKIKTLGIDPVGLSDISETKSGDFVYLRNKFQELRVLLELNRRLLEPSVTEEPIVQVWMEFR